MKPEDKVVSLETAKRLKEVGFPQDTERAWSEQADGTLRITQKIEAMQWNLAAPDAQEIGELLPSVIEGNEGIKYDLRTWREEDGWLISFVWDEDVRGFKHGHLTFKHENEAEARAACWQWLKEQKLI